MMKKFHRHVFDNFYQIGNVERLHHCFLDRQFRTIGTVVDGEKKRQTSSDFQQQMSYREKVPFFPKMASMQSVFQLTEHRMNGVCNVGVKPTFNNPDIKNPMVEVHIIDFDGDLYGKEVAVDWIKHIRKRRNSISLMRLLTQIGKDKMKAKRCFHR